MRPLLTILCALLLGAAPPEPAVRRGERVALSARIGAVVAQVEAEALQDGRPGEVIRVRNLQSGRVQPARVARAGQVEVTN